MCKLASRSGNLIEKVVAGAGAAAAAAAAVVMVRAAAV